MSTLAVNSVTDANGGNTAKINSMTPTADSLQGFRNRIINGDMRIDQRNAGASVTLSASAPYVTDRWKCNENTDGTATCQQVSDAPTGFNYSLKYTTTSADTNLTTTQSTWVAQLIEGYNIADLLWGTASAKTITISFWVKSSLTGNFSFSISNDAFNRSYVTTYAINSADTWEYKTITIAGDTSGTWLTTNGTGLVAGWYLGVGPDLTTSTTNAWQGVGRQSANGSVSVIGTLNATWFITGCQLEVGSVATPFERRPYGTELALCQRYYQKSYDQETKPGTASAWVGHVNWNFLNLGNFGNIYIRFGVSMRPSGTVTIYDPDTGNSGTLRYWNGTSETTRTTNFGADASETRLNFYDDTFNHTNLVFHWTVSSEL